MFNGEPRSAIHICSDGRRSLPEGWRWARLGQLCKSVEYGFTASANAYASGPRFLRITDLKNGHVDWDSVPSCDISPGEEHKYLLADGDIVVARTGSVGKSYLVESPPRAVFASYLLRVRLSSSVLPQYAQLYFQSDEYWLQIGASARGGIQQNVNATLLADLLIPLPPLAEQRRITAILAVRMATVERARAAAQAQLEAATKLTHSFLRQSLACSDLQTVRVRDCTTEVTTGVGECWADYRLVGATRSGIAPAKEGVGKHPERYKLVGEGAIFYNPMRILLGSIAMIAYGEEPGITSPDYVVFRSLVGRLHPVWFYHWLRSPSGDTFIKTLARGAVRERMLYRRLAGAEIQIPPWEVQVEVAEKLQTISQLQAIIRVQLDAINALPAALLRQAFTGQLTIEMQQKRRDNRIRRHMQCKLKGSQSAKRRTLWALHYQPRLRMQQRRWSGSPHTIENARKRFHRERPWR